MARAYVAKKSCGCIVAAFPVNLDKAVKGKILEQLAKGGFDIEQVSELEVRRDFALTCDHNRPPLLNMMTATVTEDERETFGESSYIDDAQDGNDDGVDEADVNAAGNDWDPENEEEAEAELEAEQAQAEFESEQLENNVEAIGDQTEESLADSPSAGVEKESIPF